MKKKLFIALLASTLVVTSISMTAFATTNKTTNPENTSTSAATLNTNNVIATTGSATKAATTTGGATSEAITTTASTVTTNSDTTTSDTQTTTSSIVNDMTFTTPTIKLSLDDTYKKLETSTSMELIALQKEMDEATAKGYVEKYSDLNKASEDKSSPSSWEYDSSNTKMMKAMRIFAKSMLEPNNTARINKLHKDTFEQYYTLKDMETQVSIAKDNLAITEKLLSNSQLKLKLGTISKMDLLTAEMNVKTAKDKYQMSQDGLNSLKMAFNTGMGYGLMQNVSLTDTIKEPALPTTSLEDAIKSAFTNRLELKESAYNVEMAQLSFDKFHAYPHLSSAYISAQASLLTATKNNEIMPDTIEMDIRTKYMNMMTTYQKVQSGKQNVSNAKETARLAQLQYDSGMTTLTNVHQANLVSYNAQLDQSKSLLDYNLAVEDYKLAQGIGTESATIVSM